MRKKVILACVDCNGRNYSTMKNQNSSERLEMKKFCKACNTHTIHKETK
ncbi:50S ribosomal protein L33 [Bacillus sp. 165]|nr:50S ribosomal protein L33 [Bacillus sp. 165]MBO9131077.1 50S ribosomal protein L33 [Bacillus sp. 165]